MCTVIFRVGGIAGLDQESEYEDILLAPNPALDVINVHVSSDHSQDIQIDIYDMLGGRKAKEIRQINEGNNRIKLEIGDLQSGTYFIKITDEENDSTIKKFIKIK